MKCIECGKEATDMWPQTPNPYAEPICGECLWNKPMSQEFMDIVLRKDLRESDNNESEAIETKEKDE